MLKCLRVVVLLIFVSALSGVFGYRKREDKTKCPQVKAIRNFDLPELLGEWFVIQYYASSEEALQYRCMRAVLSLSPHVIEITMNFTYSFADDPSNERLVGNITWNIPDTSQLAHWIHAEDTYEGVYNTYVLDSDYQTFALLLHCAEKAGSTRYLSSFIMGRMPDLGPNVVTYLRDKLPRYGIDLTYMFPMGQTDCDVVPTSTQIFMPNLNNSSITSNRRHHGKRRHPMKRHHHSSKH